MKSRLVLMLAAFVLIIAVSARSFSFPQLFWPQKDIDSSSINRPDLDKKVLIASRSSKFKKALVDKIKKDLAADSVYVKCTGLTKFRCDDTARYTAIVLINTCMAWDWDRSIHRFLKGKKNASNVIVVTTSGSGKWMPRKNPSGVDAVASASEKGDALAGDIERKVRAILEKK